MGIVPGSLEVENQPPLTVPLRHFIVGIGFLVLGCIVGLARVLSLPLPRLSVVHVHLLLVGWVCVTIMGAMTQFVPVWSGVTLHDERLAADQLTLVAGGLVGFVLSLLGGWWWALPPFGLAMLSGFWLFAYNIFRTLAQIESWDVTERHFAAALGFFLLLTLLGISIAMDLALQRYHILPIAHEQVVGAHATLAIYGAVLTTVLGALYQLATMFTQTELHRYEVRLQNLETVGYPIGVGMLALGRLLEIRMIGQLGGILVVGGIAAMGLILARRLVESQVSSTPMLTRYAVVAGSALVWSAVTLPVWMQGPLVPTSRFGPPAASHLLAIGFIGFVVLGTLYHIVPFIIWIHRYSDRLGYEDVPMIDDLYDDRLAAIDFWLVLVGGGLLAFTEGFRLAATFGIVGALLVATGVLVFSWNMLHVIRSHSPRSISQVVVPAVTGRRP